MPEIAKCRRRECKPQMYLWQKKATLIFCEECGERYQTRKEPEQAKKIWERIVDDGLSRVFTKKDR